MSTAHTPYRGEGGLFVELPSALLKLIKGIGEQAVREAQEKAHPPPAYRPSPMSALMDAAPRVLMQCYGWRRAKMFRSAYSAEIELHVVLACGHRHLIVLDEIALETSRSLPHALGDAVEKRSHERSCYCVPREVDA